eukprot:NODE_656_length_5493_cov_0.311828.p2 type:complete len:329 gc:universal NODE_656_length_5493_cov_0.311828:2820-1834(-)
MVFRMIFLGVISIQLVFRWMHKTENNSFFYRFHSRTLTNHTSVNIESYDSNQQTGDNLQFTLNIITNDRPASLERLLTSLKRANYYNHTVHIRFSLDSDSDRVTEEIVNKFEWINGHKTVQKRITKGGLMNAVSESWYPANDQDHAIFLEDDIEVSETFFHWVLYATNNYGTRHSSLVGVSLYNPTFSEVTGLNINMPSEAYLYQFPSSWGCLFFATGWKEFHQHISSMLYDDYVPYVPMSRTNKWTQSWKKYFVSYMYEYDKYMLYPPFSFSTNHVEPGTHYRTPSKFTIKRMRVELFRDVYTLSLRPFNDLPLFDIYGNLVEKLVN